MSEPHPFTTSASEPALAASDQMSERRGTPRGGVRKSSSASRFPQLAVNTSSGKEHPHRITLSRSLSSSPYGGGQQQLHHQQQQQTQQQQHGGVPIRLHTPHWCGARAPRDVFSPNPMSHSPRSDAGVGTVGGGAGSSRRDFASVHSPVRSPQPIYSPAAPWSPSPVRSSSLHHYSTSSPSSKAAVSSAKQLQHRLDTRSSSASRTSTPKDGSDSSHNLNRSAVASQSSRTGGSTRRLGQLVRHVTRRSKSASRGPSHSPSTCTSRGPAGEGDEGFEDGEGYDNVGDIYCDDDDDDDDEWIRGGSRHVYNTSRSRRRGSAHGPAPISPRSTAVIHKATHGPSSHHTKRTPSNTLSRKNALRNSASTPSSLSRKPPSAPVPAARKRDATRLSSDTRSSASSTHNRRRFVRDGGGDSNGATSPIWSDEHAQLDAWARLCVSGGSTDSSVEFSDGAYGDNEDTDDLAYSDSGGEDMSSPEATRRRLPRKPIGGGEQRGKHAHHSRIKSEAHPHVRKVARHGAQSAPRTRHAASASEPPAALQSNEEIEAEKEKEKERDEAAVDVLSIMDEDQWCQLLQRCRSSNRSNYSHVNIQQADAVSILGRKAGSDSGHNRAAAGTSTSAGTGAGTGVGVGDSGPVDAPDGLVRAATSPSDSSSAIDSAVTTPVVANSMGVYSGPSSLSSTPVSMGRVSGSEPPSTTTTGTSSTTTPYGPPEISQETLQLLVQQQAMETIDPSTQTPGYDDAALHLQTEVMNLQAMLQQTKSEAIQQQAFLIQQNDLLRQQLELQRSRRGGASKLRFTSPATEATALANAETSPRPSPTSTGIVSGSPSPQPQGRHSVSSNSCLEDDEVEY